MDYKAQAAEFYGKTKARKAADKVLANHKRRTEMKHEAAESRKKETTEHKHDEHCEKDCKE